MIEPKQYKNFASKDSTRLHLAHMHVIGGKYYITDGHRLLSGDTYKDDGVYTIEGLALTEHKPMASLPHLTKSFKSSIEWKVLVPESFGEFKTSAKAMRHTKAYLNSLDGELFWSFTQTKRSVICFNANYLRELAGLSIDMRFRQLNKGTVDKPDYTICPNSPCHITLGDQLIVIMPLRLGRP